MSTMTPKQYYTECCKNADKGLLAQGNLQDCKSIGVLNNVKQLALAAGYFDSNHIIDLIKMKKQQNKDVSNKVKNFEKFVQWVSVDPFFVTSFSDMQLDLLNKLMASEIAIILHIDASGNIVAPPEDVLKRIYLYVGCIALSILQEDQKLIFPLLEMISSAHDAFTICSLLEQFADAFQRKFNKPLRITKVVTDFSFDILNAACKAFNKKI